MAEFEIECSECGWQGMESALDEQAEESREKHFVFARIAAVPTLIN